ncbi:MAG: hypothetical protein Kow00108_16820 [Calditrichia bacterium]
MKKYSLIINISSLVLFIASLISYSIKGEWFWLSTLFLILSLLGLVVVFSQIVKQRKERKNQRSLSYGINAFTNILFVLVLISILSFITTRRHWRTDVTSNQLFSMADQTVTIMKQLDKPVKVVVFVKESEKQPYQDLLDEYAYLSDKFSYEIKDPYKNPGLVKTYNIQNVGEGVVISGTQKHKMEKVDEPTLTNAIVKVTREKQPKIYVMTGHGEKDIEQQDGNGYSTIVKLLEEESFVVNKLNLLTDKNFPDDCDLLVIAAPKSDYFPAEIDSITSYLEAGGKLLVLGDFEPKTPVSIKKLLAQYGIEITDYIVLDPSPIGQMLGYGPAVPLIQDYADHTITEKLDQASFFPMVVQVRKADTAKTLQYTELLKSGDHTWAETNIRNNQAKFDEGKDPKGPITIALLAEKEKTNILVFGDADFVANKYIGNGANRDLFQNAVSYLTGEDELISVRPKQLDDRRITMTKRDSKYVLVSVIILPLLIIVAGFVVYFRRKK